MQRRKIEEWKNSNVVVTDLPEIPFQMFLSIPKVSRVAGLGVFMFVNQ
jgi:hypothetical protein